MAFCCISTGEFHFPNELAADTAVETVEDFLKRDTSVQKVIFNVFKDLDKELYEKRLRQALTDADAVVIGAGSGLSTAAGFAYAGERFGRYFSDFEKKYGFHDM